MNLNNLPKKSTIKVENLRLRSYIGFVDWEKEKLQDVVISYSFSYNTAMATKTDDVQYAVNYKSITKDIIKLVDNQSFHLIENLAEKIFDYIQAFSPEIENIHVKVEKPHALRFADNVMVEVNGDLRYNLAMIALGSNINAEEHFQQALTHLQNLGKIVKRTDFIITKALKFEEQNDFLNGAILLLTTKSLSDLQIELKQIEALLGRVRTENKNAPRTIDLDVTTYNGFLIDKDLEELPFLIDFVKNLQPELILNL